MSCYIINKEEYVKAAGVFAYFITANQPGHETLMYYYGKDKESIYNDFIELYLNNVDNVNGHYNANDEIDENDYKDLFEKSYNDAKYIHSQSCADNREKKLLCRLWWWLYHGVSYQSCDCDECNKHYEETANPYLTRLSDYVFQYILNARNENTWTELKLNDLTKKSDTDAVDIFEL